MNTDQLKIQFKIHMYSKMYNPLKSHEHFHYVVFILDEHYCKKKKSSPGIKSIF